MSSNWLRIPSPKRTEFKHFNGTLNFTIFIFSCVKADIMLRYRINSASLQRSLVTCPATGHPRNKRARVLRTGSNLLDIAGFSGDRNADPSPSIHADQRSIIRRFVLSPPIADSRQQVTTYTHQPCCFSLSTPLGLYRRIFQMTYQRSNSTACGLHCVLKCARFNLL